MCERGHAAVQDSRVLPKLHRRVFLDKVQRDQLTVYISFYIEAANRDAFMATKQEIFMQFATACARHGAKLAQNRHQVCHNLHAGPVRQAGPGGHQGLRAWRVTVEVAWCCPRC